MSGYSPSSRSPLLFLPLLDHGGDQQPHADWHRLFWQSRSHGINHVGKDLQDHRSVQEPIYSHNGKGSPEIISGLPKSILQARKENAGKWRTLNLFITPPIPAALWKTTGEVKIWNLRLHHLIAEHDNKWLNHSFHFKRPFTLILLLITFPWRIAMSDSLSHLY